MTQWADENLIVPSDRILVEALKAEISDAIVIGVDKDGMFYVSTAKANMKEIFYMLDKAKLIIKDSVW